MLLVIVCGYAAVNILIRAHRTFKQESAVSVTSSVPPQTIGAVSEEKAPSPSSSSKSKFESSTSKLILFVSSIFSFYVILILLRGSAATASIAGVEYCSPSYWVVYAIPFVVLLAVSLFFSRHDKKFVVGIAFAGTLATLSGVSGGVVLNPILLHRGLTPQQSSATAMVITAVMSAASSFDYLISGFVPFEEALYSLFTFAGGAVGMTVVAALVKRTGRQSIVLFLLGALVAVGGAMGFVLGVQGLVASLRKGEQPFSIESVC